MPEFANHTKAKNGGRYNANEMQKDALDKLIKYHAKDVSSKEKIAKMHKLKEELNEVNKLELK